MNTDSKPIMLVRATRDIQEMGINIPELQGYLSGELDDYHVIVVPNTDRGEIQVLTIEVFRDKNFTEVEHKDFLSKLNQILKDNTKQDGKETISY